MTHAGNVSDDSFRVPAVDPLAHAAIERHVTLEDADVNVTGVKPEVVMQTLEHVCADLLVRSLHDSPLRTSAPRRCESPVNGNRLAGPQLFRRAALLIEFSICKAGATREDWLIIPPSVWCHVNDGGTGTVL